MNIKPRTLALALLLVLFLFACSLQVDPDSSITRTPPALIVPPLSPTVSRPTEPAGLATEISASTSTPTTWAGLGATGRLIFTQNEKGIIYLDLVTGTQTAFYIPPPNAWVRAAAVSPDGKLIVMAYAPPPTNGQVQLGFTDLFVMATDGSLPPTPVLRHTGPSELYVTPIWSPDGRYIYYGHFVVEDTNAGAVVKYSLNRIAYPVGQPELIATDAFWPQFSPDGSQITYISYDATKDLSILVVAKPDGSQATEVVPAGKFAAVDAPLFYPDGPPVRFSIPLVTVRSPFTVSPAWSAVEPPVLVMLKW